MLIGICIPFCTCYASFRRLFIIETVGLIVYRGACGTVHGAEYRPCWLRHFAGDSVCLVSIVLNILGRRPTFIVSIAAYCLSFFNIAIAAVMSGRDAY